MMLWDSGKGKDYTIPLVKTTIRFFQSEVDTRYCASLHLAFVSCVLWGHELVLDEPSEIKPSFGTSRNVEWDGERTPAKSCTYPDREKCRCYGAGVYVTENADTCENCVNQGTHSLRLGKSICARRIDKVQAKNELCDGRHDTSASF
jgi:hypothetical protein